MLGVIGGSELYALDGLNVEKFFEVYGGAIEKAKALLWEILKAPFTDTPADILGSLKMSIITPDSAISPAQKEWLDVLRA